MDRPPAGAVSRKSSEIRPARRREKVESSASEELRQYLDSQSPRLDDEPCPRLEPPRPTPPSRRARVLADSLRVRARNCDAAVEAYDDLELDLDRAADALDRARSVSALPSIRTDGDFWGDFDDDDDDFDPNYDFRTRRYLRRRVVGLRRSDDLLGREDRIDGSDHRRSSEIENGRDGRADPEAQLRSVVWDDPGARRSPEIENGRDGRADPEAQLRSVVWDDPGARRSPETENGRGGFFGRRRDEERADPEAQLRSLVRDVSLHLEASSLALADAAALLTKKKRP